MRPLRLRGYAPDADPTIEGVLTACSAVVPSLRGFKGAPSPVATTSTVLAGTCTGAAVVLKLDDTNRLFAGTSAQLYESSGSSWLNVSRAATYTGSSTIKWRFAQFGNVSLAANTNDTIQASSASVFADIATAPAAAVVETINQFAFALNIAVSPNESAYPAATDRWWCSGLGDQTIWTPAIATQAATGRLVAAPGPITAGRRFGDELIVYKKRSMFRGTYVGPPVIWAFLQIPGTAGAMSQEAVANIGTPENPKHIFMGPDNFYVYDGSRPVPIGTNEVKITVFNALQQSQYKATAALHDAVNGRVYFYYSVADSQLPDHCVVYNYRTDRWGVDDRTIQAAVEYVTPGVTYNDLGTSYNTYDVLPNRTYDEAFLSQKLPVPAFFDTANNLKTLTGAAGSSSFTTGDVGDDVQAMMLQRIRPRFMTAPSSVTLTNYYRMSLGDALTTDAQSQLSSGGFDVLREARWHRFKMDLTGDWEMSDYTPIFIGSGTE